MDNSYRVRYFYNLIGIGLLLFAAVQINQSASVFPHFDIAQSKHIFEPLCSNNSEKFIKSDGRGSSLFLEFRSNISRKKICEKNLTAPESHDFILRLVMPKRTKLNKNAKRINNNNNNKMHDNHHHSKNLTNICPLTVYNQYDINHTLPLWRIDPCQLEKYDSKEDPIKFFPGHISIVWEHHQNTLDSKLMLTAMGKGYGCEGSNKYPCLKVGDDPFLCISKDLICDNIRHCPKGVEYENDEDDEMCSKLKRPSHAAFNDLFEHFTMEILQNLYTSEVSNGIKFDSDSSADSSSSDSDSSSSDESNDIDDFNKMKNFLDNSDSSLNVNKLNPIELDSTNQTNNSTPKAGTDKKKYNKGSMSGDLSKYGPWGYLMLGMLLCGGALLVCGLWECCCRQNKTDPNSTGGSSINESIEPPARSHDSSPPDYDELDPPPAYYVLFPKQKSDTGNASSIPNTSIESQSSNTVAGSTVRPVDLVTVSSSIPS